MPRQILPEAARPLSAPTQDVPVAQAPSAKAPPAEEPAPEPRPRMVYVPPKHTFRLKPIEDGIKLEAIIALEGTPAAIVNGLAVKVGDMVGKAKVVLITSERVTFAYKNLRFVKSI
jgi:hypothetical protein